jgi:hypothetical protein
MREVHLVKWSSGMCDEWRAEKHRKSNFNCAWIETLTVAE